ncbi:siaz-interacting nuclear protein isoform X1 [Astyanax mexicanus]|uniref:Siaz-interacting nuclear protein isoform X1 n=1 Tax=Astyanax mexicanus TaxID=7994 RepID=A0A8T2LCZ0_ASTMX|nr:siaz-interacting nuclear protein isoform X1 [Astyanax mexicanus]
MAESVALAGHDESEQQSSEATEWCRRKIQWGSRPCQVAAVRPMTRNENPEPSGLHAARSSSPAHSSSHMNWSSTGSPQTAFAGFRHLDRLQQHPFSFDERDSLQRVARERRLERLREERVQIMDSRFQANPVRRYKPLVLKQSTRPLTVPRSPFSRVRHTNT